MRQRRIVIIELTTLISFIYQIEYVSWEHDYPLRLGWTSMEGHFLPKFYLQL